LQRSNILDLEVSKIHIVLQLVQQTDHGKLIVGAEEGVLFQHLHIAQRVHGLLDKHGKLAQISAGPTGRRLQVMGFQNGE